MTGVPDGFVTLCRQAWREKFSGPPVPDVLTETGKGGSGRRFFRLGQWPWSVVGMLAPSPPAGANGVNENESFLYVRTWLAAAGFPVPDLLGAVPEQGWVILEDAGPELLFDRWRREGESPAVKDLYRRAVELLAEIQANASAGFDLSRTHNPPYDRAFIRQFESGYFQRCLVAGVLGRDPAFLDSGLDKLAGQAGACWTPHFLYRDFQSQNIACRGNEMILLDFQGARLGPRQYDLASLLYDPYVELSPGWQDSLFELYLVRAASLEPEFDTARFREGFPLVAAHRLMQALGAYGYLSRERGKPHFAAYIPAAARLLRRLADRYPVLRDFQAWHSLILELPSIAADLAGPSVKPAAG